MIMAHELFSINILMKLQDYFKNYSYRNFLNFQFHLYINFFLKNFINQDYFNFHY